MSQHEPGYSVRTAQAADSDAFEADWGQIRWHAGDAADNGSSLTLGRAVVYAGKSNPRHCHRRCDEALLLLSGRILHTVGDDEVDLGPGDTLFIPAGEFHNARNPGPADAEMIVAYSAGDRDFVLEDDPGAPPQ
jgi:mannose-6-phosphate isomerase-like protein (cupin superfamily)